MRVALAATAVAVASIAAPAQAVTITIAPTLGGYLVSSSGYQQICPTTSGTWLGNSCITTPGVFHQFTLWDGFSLDVAALVGTITYNFGNVGSHSDNFAYSGTLVFGSNGTLLSDTMTITETGDDRGMPIITSFYQQGLYYAVPIKLADGTALVPPALPEPASWAMMIAGFGATGWALRRRREPVLRAA